MATRNPDWNEDELVLALDLYLSAKPRDLQKRSPEVLALSALLNDLHRQLGTTGEVTLRNPAGVYMKLQNLKAHDPEYLARGHRGLKAGNQLEQVLWTRYGNNPTALHEVAQAIRAFLKSDIGVSPVEDDASEELALEGRLLTRVHKTYERSRANRRKKLADFKRLNAGRVFCECCGFDFEQRYGLRGRAFIECHHQIAVSSLLPHQRLRLSDLRLVCANCHRMIHVTQPWLTVDDLKAMLKAR